MRKNTLIAVCLCACFGVLALGVGHAHAADEDFVSRLERAKMNQNSNQ